MMAMVFPPVSSHSSGAAAPWETDVGLVVVTSFDGGTDIAIHVNLRASDEGIVCISS